MALQGTLDSQEFRATTSMTKPVAIIDRSPMASFFSPASVALIGATDREGSVGCTVLHNLQNAAYKGRVFPVNPKRTEIFGLPCYPSVAAIPESVELVIVVTPAARYSRGEENISCGSSIGGSNRGVRPA